MDSDKNMNHEVTDFASSSGSNTHDPDSPNRDRSFTPIPLRQKTHTSMELDDFFKGPRDMYHHSKVPYFLRLHGSVVPKLIVPLSFVAIYATAITCIDRLYHPIGINPVLLTVTGFVVGLALSFRSTTAYERYSEGRKYWSQLHMTGRNLARLIWIHIPERHEEDRALGKADVLAKLTAMNLINAFAVSLKHRLRFEPAANYPDLAPLIGSIRTLAQEADQSALKPREPSSWKAASEYLDIPLGLSNPRKIIKQSKDNLGNIPLETLGYLSAYVEETIQNGQLKTGAHQTQVMNALAAFGDILSGTERILNTPVPLAYSISISQITWAYILVLPFQLLKNLEWVTIFGTMLGAYIVLGLAAIGYEIENPFGTDVNDLPLDSYCRELAADIDVLTSLPPPSTQRFIESEANKVLYPLSDGGYASWGQRSVADIRRALRSKATTSAMSVEIDRAVAQIESTEAARQAAQKQEQQHNEPKQERSFHSANAGDAV
ncbi:uncharacterized protein A1O9_12895 [Exophiala aquamarina CBS 119918]|uniref:Uncharacterized protein n=1 Tax=Exophiala aquamarina CBS 119918 TaxID=1182545 RepID=A0A072P600_9EURO|nr:uncharacterized protein A1O9_12895 [Exophiala aquamarina CBS 119918]KEF51045.1 hypothetical protein A1O9_12895 [Exophiala aquamarina CBS 119918]